MSLIDPYVRNPQMFICPTFGSAVTITCGSAYPQHPTNFAHGGYAANAWRDVGQRGTTEYGPTYGTGRRLGTISRPSEIALYVDVGTQTTLSACYMIAVVTQMVGGSLDGGAYSVSKRHNGGFNAVFVDGHAKWMSVNEAKNFGSY